MNSLPPIQLPARLTAPVRELSALLESLYSTRLLGLTVFGNALDDGPSSDAARAQSVMVLDRVDLAPLRGVSERAAMLGRRGLAAPLAMAPDDISASLDTFPLELIEIHQRRVTVRGRDFFESLDVRTEHVRLQCEREFKRIIMRLRQGVLVAAGHESALADLESDIGLHILRTLRGMLWIKGVPQYQPPEAVVDQCARIVGRSLDGVRSAMNAGAGHGWEEIEALYVDIEALAALADGK